MQCNTMMIEDILIFVPFSPVSVHLEILLTRFFINFIEITRGFAAKRHVNHILKGIISLYIIVELYKKAFLLVKEV